MGGPQYGSVRPVFNFTGIDVQYNTSYLASDS
jgi:hypothetical protein